MDKDQKEDTIIVQLKTNDFIDPVGIDAWPPIFSWKMESFIVGQRQTAYRIVVAKDKDFDEIVWDSEKVESDKSVGIVYEGEKLEISSKYYWKLTIWDKFGKAIDANISQFETGIWGEEAWSHSKWIQLGEIKEGQKKDLHYTVEADVTCSEEAIGLLFNVLNGSNFYMFQLNTVDNEGKVIFKPHTWKDGNYATYSGHTKDVTEVTGGPQTLKTKAVHVKIDVTNLEIVTYLNGIRIDSFRIGTVSDQGTTGISPRIGGLGFRTYGKESGTADNFILTDYTNSESGNVIYDYNFDVENPFFGGEIKDGRFIAKGVGILVMEQGSSTFRKEVTPEKNIKSARLYTAGLGVYDVFIDGERVGTKKPDGTIIYDELKPGYTHHSKRTFYHTYDVTQMLSHGKTSTLSSYVTSGWWSGEAGGSYGKKEAFRAQLLLIYEDGTREIIGTDETWKTSIQGPVIYGNIYNGETYDARTDVSFRKTGYDDSKWSFAEINKEFNGRICAQIGPSVKVRRDLELSFVSAVVYDGVTGESEGQYGKINITGKYTRGMSFTLKAGEKAVFDLGQNFAGWDEISAEGEKGTVITIRHGEMLNDNNGLRSRGNDGPEGSLYTENLRSAKATGRYIMAGRGIESYHGSTTFYGFRYAEVSATKDIVIHGMKGIVVTSVGENTGSIKTSNEKVNQLISNIFWGQYSNYLSVPTDCPQRDERKGWTADTQVFSTAASYNGDSKGFLRKFMYDMNDSQGDNGAYPDTAPYNGYGSTGQLGWGDAGIIVPYNLYKIYGDKTVIEENYENMKIFMDVFMASTNKMGGGHAYGDWLAYESNDDGIKDLFGIAYYAWDAHMMSEMAEVIERPEDAAKYMRIYEDEKLFFQKMFVDHDGNLKRKEQTACLMALHFDLLPDENSRETVKKELLGNIERNGNKLQTGFLGTSIIMQTLSDIGATGTAYKLLLQNGNPSWLYSVEQGATTVWERWNSYTIEDGFGPVSMNSFNHYAYGAVAEWMYGYMAGIMYDFKNPGFKHIILQPSPDVSIQRVDCSFDSAYGMIVSNWRYEKEKFIYEASIPANTETTLYIPLTEEQTILVNGKKTEDLSLDSDGLKYMGTENRKAVFEGASGKFVFEIK